MVGVGGSRLGGGFAAEVLSGVDLIGKPAGTRCWSSSSGDACWLTDEVKVVEENDDMEEGHLGRLILILGRG